MMVVMRRDLAWVLRRRLATQRLAGAPDATAAASVRRLVCVQAQDAPLAAWSLALRSRRATRADVDAEQASGAFVRTHILRATWHLVAAEDLRWVLHVTSPKVIQASAGRHRQLGLTAAVVDRAHARLGDLLADGAALPRAALAPELTDAAHPLAGQRAGHLLMLAELEGIVCSGPPDGATHTYTLVDRAIAPAAADRPDRDEGVRRLVHRFFQGHGPATDRDLARWCTLTLTEIRAALDELGGVLECVDVDGERMWFDPAERGSARSRPEAYLLSTFDEAALTYARHGFPRGDPATDRSRMIAEAGGGIVVVGLTDVGVFRRTVGTKAVDVTVRLDRPLAPDARDAVREAADRLAAFTQRPLRLTFA